MLFPGGEAVGGEGTLNSGEKQSCIQHYDKVNDYNDECFCLSSSTRSISPARIRLRNAVEPVEAAAWSHGCVKIN